MVEPFIRRRVIRHLEKGRIVILACGSGHPYFSTDTTAALRGSEIGARRPAEGDQGGRGVRQGPQAVRRTRSVSLDVSYEEVIERGLHVMDKTAITLCMENNLPIVVFDMSDPKNLLGLLRGETPGTIIGH